MPRQEHGDARPTDDSISDEIRMLLLCENELTDEIVSWFCSPLVNEAREQYV